MTASLASDTRTTPYGLFVLRLSLGTMWLAHGLLKLFAFGVAGFAGFLGSLGYPPFLAGPIIAAEVFGGLLILLGIYGRQVSVLLLPVMAAAMLVHVPNGWLFSAPNGGWEYPAFLIAASVTHVLAGEGAFALRARPLLFWQERSSPQVRTA